MIFLRFERRRLCQTIGNCAVMLVLILAVLRALVLVFVRILVLDSLSRLLADDTGSFESIGGTEYNADATRSRFVIFAAL